MKYISIFIMGAFFGALTAFALIGIAALTGDKSDIVSWYTVLWMAPFSGLFVAGLKFLFNKDLQRNHFRPF